MSLTVGDKLGPYEILAAIGAGGMGEVWKARDTRLDRIVAIKTSTAKFSERFEREARAVAALNHPHICTLYDVGPDYLVMEYVEGAEIRGPMPVDRTLKLAIQLASALEAAHRKGITHRDLKPANILLAKSGVKVLDFGLAKTERTKAAAANDSNDETLTRALTQEGSIVGTLQYMAPEQLQSKPTDTRADIFSFGCVLYEMLTGKRAFDAANTASVIAAILERPAPSIAEVAPPSLDWVLRRCVAKDPDDRWQSARDLRAALERVTESWSDSPPLSGNRTTSLPVWTAAGILAIAAALAFIHFRETPPAEPVLLSTSPIPENSTPAFLLLSPDGRRLAVGLEADGRMQLYVRSLDSLQLRPLANTETARTPFWSSDGKSLGFFANGKLKTVTVDGGIAQTLCDGTGPGEGGTWSRDGLILFGSTSGPLRRVSAAGGECSPVTPAMDGQQSFPEFLPDGNHFLYYFSGNDPSKSGEYLASLDDWKGQKGNISNGHRLLADSSSVIHVPPPPENRYSQLLFLRDAKLMSQPFDDRTLQITGDPVAIADQAAFSFTAPQPAASASGNGILAYVANRSGNSQLTWLDRTGRELEKVGPPGDSRGVSLSPDGKNVATVRSPNGVQGVSLRSLLSGSESRVVEQGVAPVWSPDGRYLVYSNGTDLYVRDSIGDGTETPLLKNDNTKRASDWSRDGRYLLYTEIDPKNNTDIWYLENPLGGAGERKVVRLSGSGAIKSEGQFSPDGHWVAGVTRSSGGVAEIYVRPFPSGSAQWKVSVDGGTDPRWSADGKEIYYLKRGIPNRVMTASVKPVAANTLEIGAPQKLLEFRGQAFLVTGNVFLYSVAADGRLLVNVSADTVPPTVNLINNWQKLLSGAKVP